MAVKNVGRLTKTKKAIIDVLNETNCLCSKDELVEKLVGKGLNPNRSTIYRELKFLEEIGLATKNTILNKDYYEIANHHHHHLVCLKCEGIEIIEMQGDLEDREKQIEKEHSFVVEKHTLDFFGYCKKCKN